MGSPHCLHRKLILLDTETFALTLTFLGALGSHEAARHLSRFFLPVVHTAWGCLLAAIISGGFHDLMLIGALEQLFFSTSSTRREYRLQDRGRFLKSTFNLLKGKIVPDEGEALEEIDMTKAGPLIAEALNTEFDKAAKEAQNSGAKSFERGKEMATTAFRFGRYSLLVTFLALFLLVTAAWLSSWILLQK